MSVSDRLQRELDVFLVRSAQHIVCKDGVVLSASTRLGTNSFAGRAPNMVAFTDCEVMDFDTNNVTGNVSLEELVEMVESHGGIETIEPAFKFND